MNYLRGLLGPLVLPLLGLIALTDTGCASTIASRHPHLDRRAVCVRVPGIEDDAADYVISDDGIAVSGFHPEVVDRIAPTVRTVYEFNPDADPNSVRHLPPQYQDLTCDPVFSMLPPKDDETEPLPEAAVNLLVHERRPERIPSAIAKKLASCANLNRSELESNQYTMTFNVYVDDSGQATSALLVDSTLGDHPTEQCIVDVLRSAQWPSATANLAAASEPGLRGTFVGLTPPEAPLGVKSFFAQPAPNQQPLPVGDRPSGVYKIQPQPQAPVSPPTGGGTRVPPSVFVIPLSPAIAAALAFGVVFFWSSNDAPGWASEMNPMTGKPYTSRQEYDEVQGRAPQKLKKLPRMNIEAIRSQSQPPPAPASPPAPTLTPEQQREQEKKREKCGKLATKIDEILNKKRDDTPKGGRPQGRKGLVWRWGEIAGNLGKWQPQPDGKPSKRMQGHLDAYAGDQGNLKDALDLWKKADCDDKEHALPKNARQYAAQTPEYGPGKPMEPAPLPEYRPPPRIPSVIAPQPEKGSK